MGSLLLLLVATAFVMTSVIDPNRYRGKIEGIVGDLSGRRFVIEGNVEITWFPWLGVRMGRAHLNNRLDVPGGRPDLSDSRPGLPENRADVPGHTGLPGNRAGVPGNRPGGPEDRADVPGLPILEWQSVVLACKVLPLLRGQVVVDRIRLQGPHLHLRRDAQGHGNWEDWGPARTGPSVAGEASTPEKPSLAGGASAPGKPSVAAGANAPGKPSVAAGGSALGRPSSPAGEQKALRIAGVEIRDGTLDYVDEMSGLRGSLSGVELDIGEWLRGQPLPVHARFEVHTDSLPQNGVSVEVDAAEVAIRQEPMAIAVPKVSVKVADARIDGDLTYERTADAHAQAGDSHVHAQGSVAVHAPSLRKLANDLALNQTLPHDPTTLGTLELTGDWSYADGSFAAKPLVVKLDGVNFTGWVERTAAPPALWGFELHGDRIDLGRYVSVDSTNKKPFELPVAALRAINANGSLIFDQVVLADTHMADVRLRFQTAEGKP